MIDWRSSMTQTFEFYEVDPNTWRDKKRLTCILSCKITRDLEADTLETATFRSTEILNECYIRVYLIAGQNGVDYKIPLGTFIVQTPSTSFDGKNHSILMDAYSPLLELRDVYPDLGFTIVKNQNIMDNVCKLTKQNLRAPVVTVENVKDILPKDFVAEPDESWLDYLIALMSNAKHYYMLDEIGRVLFAPKQDTASLQPKWTYDDDNSSILYPDASDDYDLYGVPNVVEVVYSGSDAYGNNMILTSRVVNDDPNSPTSTVARGREVVHRETSPSISGIPDQNYIDQYATRLLKDFNSIEHTLTYSHGYCPITIGDCARLNYRRANLSDIKAKVIRQQIDCVSGCVVTETAVYTSNLWKEG